MEELILKNREYLIPKVTIYTEDQKDHIATAFITNSKIKLWTYQEDPGDPVPFRILHD